MSFICMRIQNHLVSTASHLASLWNRGLGQFGNGLFEIEAKARSMDTNNWSFGRQTTCKPVRRASIGTEKEKQTFHYLVLVVVLLLVYLPRTWKPGRYKHKMRHKWFELSVYRVSFTLCNDGVTYVRQIKVVLCGRFSTIWYKRESGE